MTIEGNYLVIFQFYFADSMLGKHPLPCLLSRNLLLPHRHKASYARTILVCDTLNAFPDGVSEQAVETWKSQVLRFLHESYF